MSYTNETENLNLPLYVESDKPSYLGDWNQAMEDIDTGYAEVKTLEQNVSALETTVQSHINSANEYQASNDEKIANIEDELKKNSRFMESEQGKTAVFVGDSFATGIGSSASQAYPAVMSEIMGWNMVNVAVGGTGFVDGGSNGKTFQNQLNDAKTKIGDGAEDVDYVFIAGGFNDWNDSAIITYDQILSAAAATLTTARGNFPNARIVVVPMMFKNSGIDQRTADLYQGIINGCQGTNVNYQLIQGAYLWQLGTANYDGVHPNANGQKVIADKILDGTFGGDVPWQQVITKQFSVGDVDITCDFVITGFMTEIYVREVDIKRQLTAGYEYNMGSLPPRVMPLKTERIHALGSDGTYQAALAFSSSMVFVPKSAFNTEATLTFMNGTYFTHGGAVS